MTFFRRRSFAPWLSFSCARTVLLGPFGALFFLPPPPPPPPLSWEMVIACAGTSDDDFDDVCVSVIVVDSVRDFVSCSVLVCVMVTFE